MKAHVTGNLSQGHAQVGDDGVVRFSGIRW